MSGKGAKGKCQSLYGKAVMKMSVQLASNDGIQICKSDIYVKIKCTCHCFGTLQFTVGAAVSLYKLSRI